jgi:hypothetical protein
MGGIGGEPPKFLANQDSMMCKKLEISRLQITPLKNGVKTANQAKNTKAPDFSRISRISRLPLFSMRRARQARNMPPVAGLTRLERSGSHP